MFNIRKYPYVLFLLAAIVFIIVSFIQAGNSAIDIEFHDIYFVISHRFFLWLISFSFVFFYIIYHISRHILWSVILTWIHTVITIISVALITFPFAYIYNVTKRYEKSDVYDVFASMSEINEMIAFTAFIQFLAQILFLINIIIGIVIKIRNYK